MWREYINAKTVEQVLEIITRGNTHNCKIVAGATDLMLQIEQGQHPNLDTLVDISRINGLNQIIMDDKGYVHLGALVTHNDVVSSKLLRQYALPLVLAAWEVGSPQIRNRGTIVGNLVTASPANDTITPLMALDAYLVLRSLKGSRTLSLSDFYTGVRTTRLLPDEMVIEIVFKGLTANQSGIFIKHALRRAQAISLVNAAVILEIIEDRVTKASITLGAVAPTIFHVRQAEEYLVGKALDNNYINKTSELAAESTQPISDLRSSADYRKWMAKIIVKRSLEAIRDGKVSDRIPVKPALLRSGENQFGALFIQDEIRTIINGRDYIFENSSAVSLLDLIRQDGELIGTKEGCSEGECGACTVHMDGMAVMSCLVPAPRANGARITTIEGLTETEKLHPVQQAFIDKGAVQCGYCTPGLIMSSVKLLEEIQQPHKAQIIQALTGNLCRCTGYYKIIEAVEKAAAGGVR